MDCCSVNAVDWWVGVNATNLSYLFAEGTFVAKPNVVEYLVSWLSSTILVGKFNEFLPSKQIRKYVVVGC